MKKLTHLVVAGGITWVILALCDVPLVDKIVFTLLGAMVGMLPDGLDFSLFRFLGHRNRLTHNVVSPLWIVIAMLGYTIGNFFGFGLGLAIIFIISIFSHLVLDGLTRTGIYIGGRKWHGSHYSDAFLPNAILSLGGLGVFLLV
jgi:hypothetical protein